MRWLLWALFGNDEDGLYGERSGVPGYEPDRPRTFWLRLCWWCRNPFHNLTWHVLRRPGGFFWTWGSEEPGRYGGYFGFRRPEGLLGFRLWGKN